MEEPVSVLKDLAEAVDRYLSTDGGSDDHDDACDELEKTLERAIGYLRRKGVGVKISGQD